MSLSSGRKNTGLERLRHATGRRWTACVAIVALGAMTVLAGCRPTPSRVGLAAVTDEPSPAAALTEAQANPVTAPSGTPPPRRDQPIGLPRLRDYQSIRELRDIYFDVGESAIRQVDVKILDANAAWLRANPRYVLLIEGHSDNQGATNRKKEFNVDLGDRRAQAAMNYLVGEGVDASRITLLSYGEERPQCTEDTERCRSRNRRAHFLVKQR